MDIVKASCHCKKVQLELKITDNLNNVIRCNCSICSRKNGGMIFVNSDNFNLIKGENILSEYSYGTKIAKHYFCSVCGVHTHNKRRSDPSQYSINIACIENIKIEQYLNVKIFDGRDNHPCDKK